MVSKRADDISPFIVMEVLEKAQELARQGRSIIHLEVGEPDFETPDCVKEAAVRAIRDGKTRYSHSMGLLELREAISEDYHREYGVDVTPDRIIVTSGTSPAMFLVFAALLESNDEVIISNPHYACYPNFVNFLGGRTLFVNIEEEDGFQYRPEAIKEHMGDDTAAIFINSPANPTGNLLSKERMAGIADLGPYIVSDEIYHGLVYENRAHSILEFTDRAFVLNGFSKKYAMTGWRLGYIIAPKKFIRPMQKIQQNFFISASSFVQWAGIAALKEAAGDVQKMVDTYDRRRRFTIDRLRELGFGISIEPTGAFYILANARHLHKDSYHLAFDLLSEAGVAVTPGIDFGSNAEGYLRFSYANSMNNIAEGMNRIKRYLEAGKEDKSR